MQVAPVCMNLTSTFDLTYESYSINAHTRLEKFAER